MCTEQQNTGKNLGFKNYPYTYGQGLSLFINDLPTSTSFQRYADDTVLFISAKSLMSNSGCKHHIVIDFLKKEKSYGVFKEYFWNLICISNFSFCKTLWAHTHITSLHNQALKIMDKKPVQLHYCQTLKRYILLSFDNFCSYRNNFKCISSVATQPVSRNIQRQESN